MVHGYSIYGGNTVNVREKMFLAKRGEEIKYKQGLSSEILDLMKGILKNDTKARLSIKQILEHPWMVRNSSILGIDIPSSIERNRLLLNEQSL